MAMIVLIAEAKSMGTAEMAVDAQTFAAHRPAFEVQADGIMDSLRDHSIDQLSSEVGITTRLATSLQRMIYEFPNKSLGLQAIRAFTGVVFRQLALVDYDNAQWSFLKDNVRIVSSLYGWLRPDDFIKPYRFDFKSRVAPGGESLMKFWKKDVTIALVKELQARCATEIIDLLPSDAAKCVDWKVVKRFAKVYKVDFKTVRDSGELKTPNSGRLKELRGRLLDMMIREGISSAEEVSRLESADFMPNSEDAGINSTLSFITA